MPILVVDDDPDLQDAIVETLEQGGHQVRCVSNGRKALEYLRSGEPTCLILLDLMMPVMNGWEFREEQLRDARIASIPVVVISAHERRETDSFDDFLEKPIRAEDLLAAVKQFCPAGS
jgi:CheY-like chemotaxis protein